MFNLRNPLKLNTPKELWLAFVAVALFGVTTPGGKFFIDRGFSLFEISFFQLLFEALLFLSMAVVWRRFLFSANLPFLIVYGLIGAFLALAQFGGLAFGVPIALIVFILYCQPVWTIIFGKLFFKEKITFRKISSLILALSGIIIISGLATQRFTWNRALLLPLIGSLLLSLWVLWGKRGTVLKQHPVAISFGYAGFSTIWLLLLWPVAFIATKNPSIVNLSFSYPLKYWLYFLIFALFSGFIPHILYYKAIKKIEASSAGNLLLIEPVSATLLAALFFFQPITFSIVTGGILIIFSNYLLVQQDA